MWIEDYRRAHGMTVGDLAERVLALSRKRPSRRECHAGPIIARLEAEVDFRTVPGIADLIARACNATTAQRDELVLPRHRAAAARARRAREREKRGRPVAVLDAEGARIETYDTATDAALAYGVSPDYVCDRARGTAGHLDYSRLPVTFRYVEAGAWDM